MTTEDKEFICGPCDYLHTLKTAVVWCPTCEEGLCHDCSVHHTAGKLSRDHKPINIDHYKEMPMQMIEEVKKCLKHDEIYELYCPKPQNSLLCSMRERKTCKMHRCNTTS